MKLMGLQLKTQDPKQSIDFYTTILGMTLANKLEKGAEAIYVLQYPETDTYLELFYNLENPTTESYQEDRKDNYWKYSVFVADIQQAFRFLRGKGIPTNEPFQFGNIGYLMHTKDRENYQIEFIQKTFKQNTPNYILTNDLANSVGKLSLGLITIRTQDPVKSIQFFENALDMKLLVRMYVQRGNGFTLYFLGNKNLIPPHNDIDAIENREWMYQQKELFIEIQYYWGSENQEGFELGPNRNKDMGLREIQFSSGNLEEVKQSLVEKRVAFSPVYNEIRKQECIQVLSPDKQLISIL